MPKPWRSAVALLLLFAGVWAGAGAARSAARSSPLRAWKLLFVRGGNIWVASGADSGQRLLIKNGDVPCWSPDRRWIAFERGSNIWIADAHGSHQRPLTRQWKPLPRDAADIAGIENIGIAWDGSLALFYSHGQYDAQSGCPPLATSLLTIPLRPMNERLLLNLTYASEDAGYAFSEHAFPAVSCDGGTCAFACDGDVWIAVRDRVPQSPGWSISRLESMATYDSGTNRGDNWTVGTTHLSWSPDGHRLAYSLDRVSGSGQYEIHVLRVECDRFGRVTAATDRSISHDGTHPCFSPDGKWIAYRGPSPGLGWDPRSIWIMKSNGDDARLLIENGSSPAW